MDHDHSLKMTVNVHRQCCFPSIIVNTVKTCRKSMNLKGSGIDGHRQSLSSINVPPLRGGLLTDPVP